MGFSRNITFKNEIFGRWEGRSQMNVTLSMKSRNYTITPDHYNSLEEKFVGTINHTHTNGSGLVDIDPEKASIAFRSWAVSERSTTRVQRVWLYSAIVPAPNCRLKRFSVLGWSGRGRSGEGLYRFLVLSSFGTINHTRTTGLVVFRYCSSSK